MSFRLSIPKCRKVTYHISYWEVLAEVKGEYIEILGETDLLEIPEILDKYFALWQKAIPVRLSDFV